MGYADVFGKGVDIWIVLVGRMFLCSLQEPFFRANFGKERVGIGPTMVDMRNIEFVSKRHHLSIDASAANYKRLFHFTYHL